MTRKKAGDASAFSSGSAISSGSAHAPAPAPAPAVAANQSPALTAELLAVGTELLMGQIANTNAQYISARLPEVGVNVYRHVAVGDNDGRLREALRDALGRSDLVIMTGGLGPTMDDLTKESVAGLLGRRLLLHEPSLERLKERMAQFGSGHAFVKSNERQAWFPEGAAILPNPNGTAPGCVVMRRFFSGFADGAELEPRRLADRARDVGESAGENACVGAEIAGALENASAGEGGASAGAVIMLPGPPSEMKPMFDRFVMPFIAALTDRRIESRFVRVFGIGESLLEDMLMDLVDGGDHDPTIATYAKEGEVTVRVTSTRKERVDPVVSEIKRRVGDAAYSVDNEELALVAHKALLSRNLTIAFAESCTGGMAAAQFTATPGASASLVMSAVTYSNEAKKVMLGVKPATLEKYGAVSEQTAREMAEGAKRVSGADIAVSITGVAGPGGGSEDKPVGTVWFAIADGAGVRVRKIKAIGPRERVRSIACLHAFDMARRSALGMSIV